MDKLKKTPSLNDSFPHTNDNLKISNDLNNPAHKPHYDVIQGIQGGVDKARVSPNGDVNGGTTHIGKTNMDW